MGEKEVGLLRSLLELIQRSKLVIINPGWTATSLVLDSRWYRET